MTDFIRVWKEFDVNDIAEHLLMIGDLKGDCSKCRALGIDYLTAKSCPQCGTVFKYVASRTREVKKIVNKRPDLIFVDFEDYRRAIGKIKARDLFS